MPDPASHAAGDEWQRTARSLEKIVKQNPELFSDPSEWIRGLVRAMLTVCRIENPDGRAWGTGFLLGPDLVVTNNHVVEGGGFHSSPGEVRCRFGFQTRLAGAPGRSRTYPLASGGPWLVASSPTENGGLDYALMRLASKAGLDRADESPDAPRRGWVKASAASPVLRQSLFVLQHPSGDTLKMADGGLQAITAPWLCYDSNTEFGSSGSPVFDNKWELMALHSRRDPDESFNKGLVFSVILDHLPDHVRDEVRRLGPPAGVEVSQDLLERHDLTPARMEANLVEGHLLKLEGNEVNVLAGAILEAARRWTEGRPTDATCDLGSGRRSLFRLNAHAIMQSGVLADLRGTIELVVAHERGIRTKEGQRLSNLYPGVAWDELIDDQRHELRGVRMELLRKLRLFLTRLRIETLA